MNLAQTWAINKDCKNFTANDVIDSLTDVPGIDVNQDWDNESTVFEFSDGSAIVVTNSSWDLRADDCVHSCWDGIGCTCCNKG